MIDVTIRITDADGAPLGSTELAVLAALSGAPVAVVEAVQAAPAAKKTAPKAEKTSEPKKEQAPEPESPAPDTDDEGDEAKMETAVERATGFINSGEADKLRAHLKEIGVKRVSELSGADLDRFLELTA